MFYQLGMINPVPSSHCIIYLRFTIVDIISIGRGKIIVEFLSAAMLFRVCKYLSWRADGDSFMTSAASFRDREAFISPSAAITCKNNSKCKFVSSIPVNKFSQILDILNTDISNYPLFRRLHVRHISYSIYVWLILAQTADILKEIFWDQKIYFEISKVDCNYLPLLIKNL